MFNKHLPNFSVYLSFSNTMEKELCKLPAKTCRPCARATSILSGPTPSYTGQLLTVVVPSPVAVFGPTMFNWFGFGPEEMRCKYKLRKVNSVFLTSPPKGVTWKLEAVAIWSCVGREELMARMELRVCGQMTVCGKMKYAQVIYIA